MADLIDEKLNKILQNFDRMLEKTDKGENLLEKLVHFGLTSNEAKDWLEHEPNFPADRFLHEPRNRRRLDRIPGSSK